MSAEEFERQHPSPVIEWWTYDEYKKWLDNEKETLQSMILWFQGQNLIPPAL